MPPSQMTFVRLLASAAKDCRITVRKLETMATDLVEQDLSQFRPYSEIPGPKPIPVLGNTWRFIPYIGDYKIQSVDQVSKRLYHQYGDIVKIEGLLGRPDMVFLYDACEIERIFRQEERMPFRPSMPSLNYYKHVLRKDFFRGNAGVIAVHGESWYNFRSKVQQVMLQPRTARMYVGAIEETSRALLQRIAKIRDEANQVPGDFLNEIHKWSLESIAHVALDVRLGCLDDDADVETQRLINAVITFFKNVGILELKIPFWKLFSTPTWLEYVNALDTIVGTTSKYANAALTRSKEFANSGKEPSLLERILAQEGDTKLATTLALDLFLVGIDTTSSSVASVLYQLALHPEKQALAFEEISRVLPDKDAHLEAKHLENLKYVRACIKETLRMYPVVIGNGRSMTKDTVISGYQVPKGVHVVFQHYVISNQDRYFPRSKEFRPERWFEEDGVRHSFASLPFGYGRRMCLGRRFAELEMLIVLTKARLPVTLDAHGQSQAYPTVPLVTHYSSTDVLLDIENIFILASAGFIAIPGSASNALGFPLENGILQNYQVEYHHKRLEYYINPMYTPKGPLNLTFADR